MFWTLSNLLDKQLPYGMMIEHCSSVSSQPPVHRVQLKNYQDCAVLYCQDLQILAPTLYGQKSDYSDINNDDCGNNS